jgi:hypothetical protein
MPRDKFTHGAIVNFRVAVKAAAVMVARGRTGEPLASVAASLRGGVAMFDAIDSWEAPELRAEALAVAAQVEQLAGEPHRVDYLTIADAETAERINRAEADMEAAFADTAHVFPFSDADDPRAAWVDVGGDPVPIECVSRARGGALDSTLGDGFAPTHMLLAGIRVARGASGFELSIAGIRVLRESWISAGDTTFERPLFVYSGTPIHMDLRDGRVELLGLRVAPSNLDKALALVIPPNKPPTSSPSAVFGRPKP